MTWHMWVPLLMTRHLWDKHVGPIVLRWHMWGPPVLMWHLWDPHVGPTCGPTTTDVATIGPISGANTADVAPMGPACGATCADVAHVGAGVALQDLHMGLSCADVATVGPPVLLWHMWDYICWCETCGTDLCWHGTCGTRRCGPPTISAPLFTKHKIIEGKGNWTQDLPHNKVWCQPLQ